jgi:hypothetical protein
MHPLVLLALLIAAPATAHIGVNDVFFEGLAGPYPLYVSIRPPQVIPGIAEISIRAAAKDIERITIAPMTLTGPGSIYPPTPDITTRSSVDPQLFQGAVWIMNAGAWQVRLQVEGKRGAAKLGVPVRAVSKRVTTMDRTTGTILAVLIGMLAFGAAGILSAAFREAQLAPGDLPDPRRRRRGQYALAAGTALAVALIWLGWAWWGAEAQDYERSIYRSLALRPQLAGNKLLLNLEHTGWFQKQSLDDLAADHGYPMHLYAVRKPNLDVVYHLHPKQLSPGRFELPLPALPKGDYQLFGDIVHSGGFPETLTASVLISEQISPGANQEDDAGAILRDKFDLKTEQNLDDLRVRMLSPVRTQASAPLTLRFLVEDRNGNPASNLTSYLGMPAHLAILAQDLSVFSHVHPAGNISMTAFEIAQKNILPISANVLPSVHGSTAASERVEAEFNFPFGFPRAGNYRLILQFRADGIVRTTAFDIVAE